MVRPVTTQVVAPVVVQVLSSGDEVTVYPVTGAPPSEAGASHITVALASPAVADAAEGADGAVATRSARLCWPPAAMAVTLDWASTGTLA